MKSSSSVSLNDTLMVGPTLHSTLTDVLLRFRLYPVAITADISKMYRAVELATDDKDYHRFVWRREPEGPLTDYRMNRLTFGVSASSFAANMAVRQNAMDFADDHPCAAAVVAKSLYVDDCLTGANTVEEAVSLQTKLQELFGKGKFTLRKWNSSHPAALKHVSPELRESHFTQTIPDPPEYVKTLGIQWNSKKDVFCLTVSDPPSNQSLTKRSLASDVAKTFDILGWFAPSTIKAKILLQRLWERKIGWDETVPTDLLDTWRRWRTELNLLSDIPIRRCYFHHDPSECHTQLHGFSDASEEAYTAVVYLCVQEPNGTIHISIVMGKTRVAPLKRLTIPRLELCGTLLLAQTMSHIQTVLDISPHNVYAWTDSTVVLAWLNGDPRRFKTFVSNRVSQIVKCVPSQKWRHVSGHDNPTDCASRGLLPSELVTHNLWWNGPAWLSQDISHWPHTNSTHLLDTPEDTDITTCLLNSSQLSNVLEVKRYSSYERVKRVMAWILRFVNNCSPNRQGRRGPLCTPELTEAESLLWLQAQLDEFSTDLQTLKNGKNLPRNSPLRTLHPITEESGLLRVGGRVSNSSFSYSQRHPVILHGRNPLTKLIIRAEHLRLLHGGPTLVSSLSRRFHIIGHRKTIRSVTRACITCRRTSTRPRPQLMGQLPIERITPGMVFERVGIDYAGPVLLKVGCVRKPTLIKAYIGIFVSLTVKAVHIELISDLTTSAFIASLRRFVARRGKPATIWSDHGSNLLVQCES